MLFERRIEIRESWVDATRHVGIGATDWYIPWMDADDIGVLYRSLQKEHGKCVSKVYIDTNDPAKPRPVGWVFQKRKPYDDCNETFLLETWIEYRITEVSDGEQIA